MAGLANLCTHAVAKKTDSYQQDLYLHHYCTHIIASGIKTLFNNQYSTITTSYVHQLLFQSSPKFKCFSGNRWIAILNKQAATVPTVDISQLLSENRSNINTKIYCYTLCTRKCHRLNPTLIKHPQWNTFWCSFQYITCFRYGGNAKVVHFLGKTKPWSYTFDPKGKQITGSAHEATIHPTFLLDWWTLYSSTVVPMLQEQYGDQPFHSGCVEVNIRFVAFIYTVVYSWRGKRPNWKCTF